MPLCYAYLTSNHLRAGIQALKQRNLREQTGFALPSEGVPPVSRERTGERVRIGLPNGKTVPTRFCATRSIGFHLFLRVHSFDRHLIPHTVHEAI